MINQADQSCVLDNAPDWRWKRALYERKNEKEGNLDFVASTDLVIKLAKRFLKLWEDDRFQGAPARELMPGMAFLYDLHQEHSPGCTRHALEASLVANAKPQFIQSKVHKKLTPFVVRTYELLFYDVRDKLDSPFWVEKYIFGPAMVHKKDDILNSDLIWKVVAYKGGPERLLMDCLRGHTYQGKDADWIINHVVSQNARETLKYVHTSGKLPKELTIPAQHRTMGVWEDRTYKLDELTDKADSTLVPEKLATFHNRLKMRDADEPVEKIEKLDGNIHKYEDGDLDK
jgi:hypothetical protein